MRNNSFKKLITLALAFILTSYNAQCKKINLLIMIDDQPCILTHDVQIITPSMDLVDAKYIVGTIDLSDDNYNKFTNDQSKNFEFSFKTFLPNGSLPNKYVVNIPKNFLNQEFIIINIFNKENKSYKKRYAGVKNIIKEYYVVISTRNAMKFD